MGDSYISGESGHLIGNNSAERRGNAYEEGTDVGDGNGCRRSDVAPINSAGIPGVTPINIACSGALTTDVIGTGDGSRTGRSGEPLQIDQLQEIAAVNDVEMVVVSIGGNDAGFWRLGSECALRYAIGSNCEFNEAPGYAQQIANVMEPAVRDTVAEVQRVLAEAGQPDTRIVLQSYPSPVPTSTAYDGLQRVNHGCVFKASDMRYINTSFIPLLDSTLGRVARDQGVEFLSLADAFDGKEVCSPEVTSRDNTADHAALEWTTGIRVSGGAPTQASVHPNALGQMALGRCLGLVWSSSGTSHACFNNGGDPSDMRLTSSGGGLVDPGNPVDPGTSGGGTPDCESSASDTDGDGWGWENDQSCRVVTDPADSGNPGGGTPDCESSVSDTDGDGWGWENDQSCRVVGA